MASQHPNSFLSRVFGVDSSLRNTETELSSINDAYHSDDEDPLLASVTRGGRERSLIESDDDDNSAGTDSEYGSESNMLAGSSASNSNSNSNINNNNHHHLNHVNYTNGLKEIGEDDEDESQAVPISLMVQTDPNSQAETQQKTTQPRFNQLKTNIGKNLRVPDRFKSIPSAVAFQLSSRSKADEEAQLPTSFKRQQEYDLHEQQQQRGSYQPSALSMEEERRRRAKLGILSPRERALWKWANVENLDKFLQDVYSYYLGNGFYCIILSRVLDLATLAFVVYFSTYLTTCIDYSKLKLPTSRSLSDIAVDQCYSQMSWGRRFVLWCFYIYFFLKLVQLYFDSKELKEIHLFYNYLLDISDKELQTISWQVVVRRLMQLKDQNAITSNVSDQKSKSRIDAHDIANRIMRRENYFIALYNKDILDLTLPIPGYTDNILTKTLEWNLNLCISGFVFNDQGQIRQQFLKENKRKELADELKKRFILAGIFNIILSPFIVTYFVLLYFFRYFNEYRRNPGSIGMRQYTPLAEWKFREFNELYHLFQKRLCLSVPEASNYTNQFPKEKTVLILKFVAFISGSFAAVLGILSIVDPDMFFNFEITQDRTVLFYISIFGTIWAICHGAIPEEYQVFDSEASLRKVAAYTHYLPKSWEGNYHTDQVKVEFCKLFDLKALLLLRELASLVMTPFILWFSLPKCSNKIVDFFREFSVHVDGLGYVCTFAMFNFEKTKKDQKVPDPRANYYGSGEDKMMKSYLYFLDSYGNNETKRNGPSSNTSKNRNLQNSVYSKAAQSLSPLNKFTERNDDFHASTFEPLDHRLANKHRDNAKLKSSEYSDHLSGSFITKLPKIDDGADIEDDSAKDPGVLGLLNQFYKDYEIAK